MDLNEDAGQDLQESNPNENQKTRKEETLKKREPFMSLQKQTEPIFDKMSSDYTKTSLGLKALQKDAPQDSQKFLDTAFLLIKLYIRLGEFKKARAHVEETLAYSLKQGDIESYLKCQNMLLRFYFEMGEKEKFFQLKKDLIALVGKNKKLATAYCYYSFGLYESYEENYHRALFYLKEGLKLAESNGSDEDMVYVLSGLANVYFHQGNISESLEKIRQVESFGDKVPEVHVSLDFIRSRVLCQEQKYMEALDVLWKCYKKEEELKSFTYRTDIFYAIGNVYMQLKDKESSKVYFNLAYKSVEKEERNAFAIQLEKKIMDLDIHNHTDSYDLLINERENLIVEKAQGVIDFKNQAVLSTLLHLLVQSQGKSFSKEELYHHLWNGSYSSSLHDNKIYVAIKRLRKIIEGVEGKAKYIFRSPQGYFFNKSSRVRIIK